MQSKKRPAIAAASRWLGVHLLTAAWFSASPSAALAQVQPDPRFRMADSLCSRQAATGGGARDDIACMQRRGYAVQPGQPVPHLVRGSAEAPVPTLHEPVAGLGRPASDETQAMVLQADTLVAQAYERSGRPAGFSREFYNDADRYRAIALFLQAGEAGDERGVVGWCVQTWGKTDDTNTDTVRNCIASRALYNQNKAVAHHEQAVQDSALPPAAQVLATRLNAGETVRLYCVPTDQRDKKDYLGKPILPTTADAYTVTLNTGKGVVDLGTVQVARPWLKPASRGHYENGADGPDRSPIGMNDGSWGHKEIVRIESRGIGQQVIKFTHENYREGRLVGGGTGGRFDIRTQDLQYGDGYGTNHAHCAVTAENALAGALTQMSAAR